MKSNFSEQGTPKLYGVTTVGERGQVVIPAEARRDFKITPTTKLLVFGNQGHGGLMLIRAEAVSEFITTATRTLVHFEEALKMGGDSDESGE
jgi:AbrB family looped-hinge helix DNA binding protein